jgi:hypothetical protein
MKEILQSKMTDKAASPRQGRSSGSGLFRHPVACFLYVLSVMLISTPFIQHLKSGEIIAGLMMTMVLLFAVPAVGNSRMALVWAIVLVIPAIIAKWVYHLWPNVMPQIAFLVFGFLFILFVIANLFHFIFRTRRVDSEVLSAGIATHLMICLLFSLVYQLVALLVPDSFAFSAAVANSSMKGFTATYFSFITLCTVGYGDIIPVSDAARAVAMAEGGIGVFYIATLIARLVSLYSSREITEKM